MPHGMTLGEMYEAIAKVQTDPAAKDQFEAAYKEANDQLKKLKRKPGYPFGCGQSLTPILYDKLVERGLIKK